MNTEAWISDASHWSPRHLVPSAWLEHAPFAYWLIDAIRPDSVVELGTHNGFSYFVFCDAITRLGLATRAFALDSWEGDDQAGFYGDEVYESVAAVNQAEYSGFSTLLRGYFDDSLDLVADASVDLLHIDGRHGYDDVRHDFEAWRPKLTDRGVVIFHDIAEHQEGFGVWQFWAEISQQYPSFAFDHGHGLGVLAVGAGTPPALLGFLDAGAKQAEEIKAVYAALGAHVSQQFELKMARQESDRLQAELQETRMQLEATNRQVASRDEDLQRMGAVVDEFRGSTSWKVTRPLRAARDLFRRRS